MVTTTRSQLHAHHGDVVIRPIDLRDTARKARAGAHMGYVQKGAGKRDVIRIPHHCQNVRQHL